MKILFGVFFSIVLLLLSLTTIADIIPIGECPGFAGFSETTIKALGEISRHSEAVSSKETNGYIKIYKSITFLSNEEEIDFVSAVSGESCWKVRYAIQRYSPKLFPGKTLSIKVYIEGSWVAKNKDESSIVFHLYFKLKKERVAIIYTDIFPFPVTDYYRAMAPQEKGIVFLPLIPRSVTKVATSWASLKAKGESK